MLFLGLDLKFRFIT